MENEPREHGHSQENGLLKDWIMFQYHRVPANRERIPYLECLELELFNELGGDGKQKAKSSRRRKAKAKRREALHHLLANLIDAMNHGKAVSIPMGAEAFTRGGSVFVRDRRIEGFTYDNVHRYWHMPERQMRWAVKQMEKHGYLHRTCGREGKHYTLLRSTYKLFYRVYPEPTEQPIVMRHDWRKHDLIVSRYKEPVLDKFGNQAYDKRHRPLRKNITITTPQGMRIKAGEEILRRFNAKLETTHISVKLTNQQITNLRILHQNPTPHPSIYPRQRNDNEVVTCCYDTDLRGEESVVIDAILVRIFQRSIEERCVYYGRLHNEGGLGWQGIPRTARPSITIDGESTYELDFKNMHFNMCYALVGMWSPYADNYVILGWPDHLRPLIKKVALTSLNCSGKAGTLRAVKNLVEDIEEALLDDDRGTPSGDDLELLQLYSIYRRQISEMYDALVAMHSHIAEFISDDAGIGLMNTDGGIMLDIIDRCMDEDILALSIHDSIIVKREHEKRATEIMHDVYRLHMNGYTCPIERK